MLLTSWADLERGAGLGAERSGSRRESSEAKGANLFLLYEMTSVWRASRRCGYDAENKLRGEFFHDGGMVRVRSRLSI